MDIVDTLEKNRPLRAPMTPEQLQDLKQRLGQSKRETQARGHDWDVADIVEVVRGFDAYHSAT